MLSRLKALRWPHHLVWGGANSVHFGQVLLNSTALFQDWRLYGERGLAHHKLSIWVYEGTLKVEYQAVTLSKYHVELEEDRKHLKSVGHPRLAETVFRSPQLTLFDLGPDEWILYWKAQPYARRRRPRLVSGIIQPVLFKVPVEEKAAEAESIQAPLRLIGRPKKGSGQKGNAVVE